MHRTDGCRSVAACNVVLPLLLSNTSQTLLHGLPKKLLGGESFQQAIHRYQGAGLDGARLAGISDRTCVLRAGTEVVQRPSARRVVVTAERYHPRRGPRPQGDAKTVQWYGEAAAHRLDEGFLASPAVKKTRGRFGRGKRQQFGRLFGREEPAGDVFEVGERAIPLDIDADLTAVGESIRSQVAGMGCVELQRRRGIFGRGRERRLALRPIYELDRGGVHAKVTRQQHP